MIGTNYFLPNSDYDIKKLKIKLFKSLPDRCACHVTFIFRFSEGPGSLCNGLANTNKQQTNRQTRVFVSASVLNRVQMFDMIQQYCY